MSAAAAADAPAKVDPESLALRAQPRPVVRLNRRMLALGAGTLAAAVLGGTLWSLQVQQRARHPATELFNVDRVARAEDLERLPKDYAGMSPVQKPQPPVLGEPLPGDLGPAIVKAGSSRMRWVLASIPSRPSGWRPRKRRGLRCFSAAAGRAVE